MLRKVLFLHSITLFCRGVWDVLIWWWIPSFLKNFWNSREIYSRSPYVLSPLCLVLVWTSTIVVYDFNAWMVLTLIFEKMHNYEVTRIIYQTNKVFGTTKREWETSHISRSVHKWEVKRFEFYVLEIVIETFHLKDNYCKERLVRRVPWFLLFFK